MTAPLLLLVPRRRTHLCLWRWRRWRRGLNDCYLWGLHWSPCWARGRRWGRLDPGNNCRNRGGRGYDYGRGGGDCRLLLLWRRGWGWRTKRVGCHSAGGGDAINGSCSGGVFGCGCCCDGVFLACDCCSCGSGGGDAVIGCGGGSCDVQRQGWQVWLRRRRGRVIVGQLRQLRWLLSGSLWPFHSSIPTAAKQWSNLAGSALHPAGHSVPTKTTVTPH